MWQPNTHKSRTKNCQESRQNKGTLSWLYLQGKTFQSLSPVLLQKPQEARCPQAALICKLNTLKDVCLQVLWVYSEWVSHPFISTENYLQKQRVFSTIPGDDILWEKTPSNLTRLVRKRQKAAKIWSVAFLFFYCMKAKLLVFSCKAPWRPFPSFYL